MSSLLYLFPSLRHALCSELSSSWCGSDAGTEVYYSLCHMMLFSCLQPLITVKWRLIALITFQRTLCSPSWNNICSDRSVVSLFSHTDHMTGRIWFSLVSSWKFKYMCNTCSLSYFQSVHWSTYRLHPVCSHFLVSVEAILFIWNDIVTKKKRHWELLLLLDRILILDYLKYFLTHSMISPALSW